MLALCMLLMCLSHDGEAGGRVLERAPSPEFSREEVMQLASVASLLTSLDLPR